MWAHYTLQINSSPDLMKVFSLISGNVLGAKQTFTNSCCEYPNVFYCGPKVKDRRGIQGPCSHSTELCTTCAVCSNLCSGREVCKLQMCIWKMDVLDCMHLNFNF